MEVEAQQIPQALGDLFSQILEIKQSGDVNLDDLKARLSAGAVKILELKALHRGMCENTEALREATADAKVQLDQSSLQLQSLLYEKHHYEKEIQACTSFRSAYSDEQLELIPEQEYVAQRASGDAEQLPSSDPHQLMLDRLQHEHTSREATVKDLEALKAKRDGLAADVAQRRSALAGLDSEITRLRNSAQRVQKNYNMQTVGDHDQLATLLPAPLYLLYTHLKAAAAVDALPLQISVGGEQASALKKQMHQAMVRSPSAPANVVEATLAKAAEQACQLNGNERTAAFPLTVVAAVDSEGHGATASLGATFSYIPNLNLVTVAGANKAQDAQLASLFSGDGGAAALPAAVAGVDVATLPGVPYAWVQRAAAIDLLPPVDQLVAKGGGAGGAAALSAVQKYQHERRGAAVAQKLVQAAQST